MKKVLIPVSVFIFQSQVYAFSVLNCATAMGGFDEVQKFQIIRTAENNLIVQRNEADGLQNLGPCKEFNSKISCTFSTRESTREYKLIISQPNNKGIANGTIDQIFRAEGEVRCIDPNRNVDET